MNKRGRSWNIGLGGALIIAGVYSLTRETTFTSILGIVFIGIGLWLLFK
jgi:hypothetical protein